VPSTVINITASAAVGGATSGRAAASSLLGVFDAIMGAACAGAEGAPLDGKLAGGGPHAPGQHNLDVGKLPANGHPAKAAAAAAAALVAATAGEGSIPAATAEALATDLTAAKDAAAAIDAAPATGAKAEEAAPAETASAAMDLAASALVQTPAAPVVQTTSAAAAASSGATAADAGAQLPASPEAVADVTLKHAEEGKPKAIPGANASDTAPEAPAEVTLKHAEEGKPKTIPGANASGAARLHAAENSAVMRAVSAQQSAPAPATQPATTEVPPAIAGDAAVDTAAVETLAAATHAEPVPQTPVSQSRKAPASRPAGGERVGTPVDAAAQPSTPAGAAASTDDPSAPADKEPKLAAAPAAPQDAPRAQPDDALPPAPAEAARTHAAAPSAAASAEVRGSPETVASLAAQIVKKLGARTTHFDVQLDPAGLGKVNVRVVIGPDGQVSAAMSFDNPQAAAELKSRAAELHRSLAQSGFDLSGGLSFDVAQDQGGGYGGQQNAFGSQDGANSGNAFRGRAFAAALATAGDAVQAALPGAYSFARGADKGVDVRV